MSIAAETAGMDATAQAELVKKGDVTAGELLDAAIERAERVNGELNAIVTPMYDHAREAVTGAPSGPFEGVPFLLKDLTAQYAGVPLKSGCKLLENFVPTADSELVKRQKAAGLITFGKTSTPEFGFMAVTEAQLYGPCRNPWDTNVTPGGSSGGAAAAVAAGIVPMAHASDGGGSIRIPASCCGLFGMKPTRARNSSAPAFGDHMSGLPIEHCVSRTVRDSALLLDCTDGYVDGDPYCAPHKTAPFVGVVAQDPGKLRIAFTADAPNGQPVHSDCRAAVVDAAKLLEGLGHHVEEKPLPYDGKKVGRAFADVWASGALFSISSAAGLHGRDAQEDDVETLSWALYEMGRKVTGAQYLKAIRTLQQMGRQVAAFMKEYDVILTPVLGEPPLPIGELMPRPGKPLYGFHRSAQFVPFTGFVNGAGNPAMSVPLYWNDAGLPIGTQFVGRFGDEATLFRLAGQLEQARPWAGKRPPVYAG